MSRTVSIAMLLTGLVLFVGSCAPIGVLIYHEALTAPTESFLLSSPGSIDQARVNGTPGELVRFAIEAEISTASVQEDTQGLTDDYEARFKFPVSYTLRDASGNSFITEEAMLAWKDGGRIIKSNERVSSTGGSLKALAHFEKFRVPEEGLVDITFELSPDNTYQANISTSTLHYYQGMIDNTWYIAGSVLMFISGFILAMTGFIFSVANSTQTSQPAIAGQQTEAGGVPIHDKQANQQAMFIQLSALAGYFIPFGSIIMPLALWLAWRDKDPYINDMGREAVNFQLSMLVYYVVCIVLMLVLIGIIMIIPVMIFHLTYIIIASVQISRGVDFHYPLSIRFIRT